MPSQTNLKKILCVEDEKDLRDNIALYLNQKGFDIIEAANGEEAYQKYVDNRPDIILCDINMPKMNGQQLLEKLTANFPENKNDIPFIFLTALGQKNDFIKGLDLGADEYVIKPIDFDVLLSTINSKLAKSELNQEFAKNKINQFCDQVSHLLPKEVHEPLEAIIKYSATLKKESFGAFIEPKYVELATKIYIASLKLNVQISKALCGDNIKNEVNNLKDNIDLNLLSEELKDIFKDFPIEFTLLPDLPTLQGNLVSLKSNLVAYLSQQISASAREITVNIFLDYQENLIISVSSYTSLPVVSEDLELMLQLHNGKFSIIEKEGKTHHLLSLPNYLVKHLKLSA